MKKHVKAMFLDWQEGRLSEKAKKEVEHHLAECPETRAYFEKMADALGPADSSIFPKLDADPYLPTRINALAEERNRNRLAKAQKAIRTSAAIRLSFSALMLFIAVTIGIFLGKGLAGDSSSATMYSDEELINGYYQAFSQQDASNDLESIFETQSRERDEN